MIEINRKEALRYLGYRQSIEGDLTEINSALDHCIEVLQKTAVPRHIVKRLPLTIENHTITIGDMVIHSKNLENNLKGCHAVYLFAATIGIEVDRLIKRTELTKMSDAVIYQAAGAAMIEAYCDEVNEELNQEYTYCYDRSTSNEKRPKKEIGIAAVRGGTIVGEHDVIFAGSDEVITFSHTAYSKAVFAKGAIQAAKFLKGKQAGLYNMSHVIDAQ